MSDTPAAEKAWFKKEIITSPLYLKGGAKIPIQVFGDIGLIETSDPTFLLTLRTAQKQRMGGIVEIDSEQFEELKKNPPVKRSNPTSERPWLQNRVHPNQQNGVAAQVSQAPQKVAPMKLPDKEPLLAQLANVKKGRPALGDLIEAAKQALDK